MENYKIGSKVKHKKRGVIETIVGECKVKINNEWVEGVIYEGVDYNTGCIMKFVRTKNDFINNFELMEFNSQICTTKEQSLRLLALGLKKETADMGIVKSTNEIYIGCPTDYSFERDLHIPAWSLHRLLVMLTYQVIYNDTKYEPVINFDGMAYQDVCSGDPIVGWSGDLYTDIIDCIDWLISQNQFNPDYLEESSCQILNTIKD